MPIHVGITGGIGTGKSFVSRIFKTMGVPFYDADLEAKQIMVTNSVIRKGLIDAFGTAVYFPDGTLDRKYLSDRVFNNQEQLDILNAIVHPVVIQAGIDWSQRQVAPYTLKEAALLFESGSYKSLQINILVSAPLELRIQRVMERDGSSREEVFNRMARQMPEEEKISYADVIIVNDGVQPLLPQIIDFHQRIMSQHA